MSEQQPPVKRLTFEEKMARFQQIARERQALDTSYADLMADVKRQADEAQHLDEKPQLPGEVVAMIARLVNYVNMEREQSNMMFELLTSAYAELVEAYSD